ncbi:MAG: primosomal protein N' [Flammeovirgaceae bacterium]|nr:MAG: primosomal protein N' [Flammeovirgaceae bacterium]
MTKQLPLENPERITLFAELILPVPVPKLFTYRVPLEFNERIAPGQRAIVPFGDRKILTGIISIVHQNPPREYEVKYLLELLDDEPTVNSLQLNLFNWIAAYYLCAPGEVMNAALPSGLKLSSESKAQLHPAFDWSETLFEFTEKEEMLLKQLQHGPMTYSEISKLLGVKTIYAILKSLVRKEAVILFEEVHEKYKPKTERKVRLAQHYLSNDALHELFNTLASRPKQEALVLKYLQEVPVMHDAGQNKAGLSRKKLLEGHSSESSLNTLIKHGIFEEFEVIISRFDKDTSREQPENTLSDDQLRARDEILQSFEKSNVTLFHGITGSGKTEIYISLIKQALDAGSQVLYLLPEIALTTQIVQRLKKVFGNMMGVYHSRFSDNERVEVWRGILSGKVKFVVGVRSAVFLPFDNLGLIIVDEEHDTSFKQQEPAPRYHARDVALIMGQLHHARVLLGSATPSLESYWLAHSGKYGLVQLHSRFGEARLPTIALADLSRERREKKNKGQFTSALLKAIEETLARKEQVIVFQNRRGYAPLLECEDCGWIPRCTNCSVSLTYHQYKSALVCHYCGYREPMPTACRNCSSRRLLTSGYGTEKLEEELRLHFPEAAIQRMDLETTRSKSGYENIISEFEAGRTDILVGTQMVTKGLDFGRVSLVGVFNADRMFHFPDFRSHERAFQLLTQVSGRAGRKDKPGTVIIQTSQPQHPLLNVVLNHRVNEFYTLELDDRKAHQYPPFTRLIELTLKHTDKKTVNEASAALAELLRHELTGVKILGPGEPMVSKIRNQYLMSILIKIPRHTGNLQDIKRILTAGIGTLSENSAFRNVRTVVDVDPY